jgi:3,4-dihydroxy 2-butanone 4-phosphate synthase/GTP cyclohydrolase II
MPPQAWVPGSAPRTGHVFPLRARPGGVLERSGHTEAAVDLCRLAGLSPVGLITEVVEDDGTLMRLPALRRLADSRDLPLISIEDLVAHRRELGEERSEHRVERVAVTRLPTRFGTFEAHGYRDRHTAAEHVVLLAAAPAEPLSAEPLSAEPLPAEPPPVPLVRVHSECLTGDTLGSLRCDCGPQLETSLREVAVAGGAVVYLGGHEGRGIGLLAKLTAYQLQDDGQDTVSANLSQGLPVDAREYGAAAAILHDLGLTRIALLTNNPDKVAALTERGIEVVRRVPLVVGESEHNRSYLHTKRHLMGHQL